MPSKTSAKKATRSAGKSTVIAIKVHFELITPNRLRRVIFGLEKGTQGDEVTWKIEFQLFEREKRTDAFGDAIVTLQFELKKALNAKAEKTSKGVTPGQTAHALGPAADDAKAARAGEISEEEAKETIEATIRKA